LLSPQPPSAKFHAVYSIGYNTYRPEYDMMIRGEYRDGNVNPGFRQMEKLVESLGLLP
jgi:hypothetical protein